MRKHDDDESLTIHFFKKMCVYNNGQKRSKQTEKKSVE